MSVVKLEKITSASKEAYFSWEITLPSGIDFKKGMLCLTDIDQDADPDSAIFKYQLHSTESPAGSHIFEGLHVGDYYARLTIIGSDNSINVSELLTVTVFDLGAASINTVSARDSSFFITLNPYDGVLQAGQEIIKVSFVLFGRKTNASGLLPTGTTSSEHLNIVIDYNNNNTYTLTSGIKNSWKYEIACFYTDSQEVSGDISNTVVETPTNKPNIITGVEPVYDYTNKKLIIKYTNPDDISEWTPNYVRATLTYGSTVKTYEFPISSSSNSGTTVGGQQLVFNENSLLTPDTSFTLTLAMSSTVYGYSDFESDAITCIVPLRFCSEPTAISIVEYIVGDNEFSVTYTKVNLDKYDVRVRMLITPHNSTVVVYENTNYTTGFAVDVENGEYYKVNLQVFYTSIIDSSIVFGPCTNDVNHFNKTFIPHGQAEAPSNLSVVYGDGTATLSWGAPSSFHGYILDHYEVYDGSTWISTQANATFRASCYNENNGKIIYVSGTPYNFQVRAVTKSPDTSVYAGIERTNGQTSSIAVYPLKKPQPPVIVSHIPGNTICDVTFQDGLLYSGVKQNYEYTIINTTLSGEIPSTGTSTSTSTSKQFIGLTNNTTATIKITTVTKSGPNNIQRSDQLEFDTTPFIMPVVPTSFSAKPWTAIVDLTWSANNPPTILERDVQYDVEYKLVGASTWNTSNSSVTSPLPISGLTSNSEYNFRIRSKIWNVENGITLYSEYSTPITSRPFVYTNPPTMILTAGNGTISVQITPPVSPNNNYYGPRAYHASVDPDPDTNGSDTVILEKSSNTSTITFNVDDSGLVNLDKYRVVAWYDMLSPGITESYPSNTVSNSATPFDKTIVPDLYSDPDDGNITLSWDDLNMYGLVITHYEVSSKLHSDTVWGEYARLSVAECNQEPSTSQNTRKYEIVMLATNGTKMNYKIRAVIYNGNIEYTSDDSNVAVGTPYTEADAPTLVSYVSSDQQITLTWAQPLSLGGLPLLYYEVSTDSFDNLTRIIDSTTHSFNTTLVNGTTALVNGTTYTFSVRAVTDISDNVSQASNLDTVNENRSSHNLNKNAIPYAVPTITLDTVVSGDDELTLNWSRNLGGHPFNHYNIYYNGVKYGETVSTDLHYTISGLNNGTTYACMVEVYVEDNNTSPVLGAVFPTSSSSKTNIPYVAAIAPSVTSVPSDTSVRVSWDNLTTLEDLGGLPLLRYEVKKEGDSIWIPANDNLSHNFTELTNGITYTFKVSAVTTNAHFASDPEIETDEVIGAAISISDIPYLPLAAPAISSCLPGNRTVSLSWAAPSLVGLTLDHYEVFGGSLSEPFNVGTSSEYVFTDLSNNTVYSFYVTAVANHTYAGQKTGPNSESSKIPYANPEPVTNLTCNAVNGVLTVYFDAPNTSSVNNGLAQDYKIKLVREYESIYDIDYETITNGGTKDIPTDTTETIQVYVYSRIRDPNNPDNNTNSVYSSKNQINVVNTNLLSDIQNLTATVGDQKITLNWENINANSGSTYAIVRIKNDGSFERLSNVYEPKAIITTLSDGSSLVNGTLYRFNVYASQDDMLQITATPIGPPKDLSANNTTVNVNFNGDSKVGITIIGITETDAEIIPTEYYTTTSDKLTTINQLTTKNNKDLNLYLKYVVIASNSVGSTYIVSE